eukprot:gnl/MRDRNA2_/MRDRNA2_72316_c0_seq1.p1 gnl/MRDRNA2_/MRDRNA2_72316_c0~~gnl/MRDRNA2_/MRDRNA2_72316_c0_seq1.p1  ORF type:complete len:661 (+),score=80.38 gnl/MRDRNA2_/MRDRNA2_72316_c0_seq1:113-2095(+)
MEQPQQPRNFKGLGGGEAIELRQDDHVFWRSLVAGAIAGCTVDVVLFPLDSLKTRLQAKQGFANSGKLQKLYRGLPTLMVGDSAASALFFATYEQAKILFGTPDGSLHTAGRDGLCAALGETVACTIRTPTEILKQRMQTLQVQGIADGIRSIKACDLLPSFRALVARDLVFSSIQFPSYEILKALVSKKYDRKLQFWECALCGSLTSTLTAVVTTPLDVVKTRIMLDKGSGMGNLRGTIQEIYRSEGMKGFMRGAAPRALWMGLGGMIFLGSYERAKNFLEADTEYTQEHPFRRTYTNSYWRIYQNPQCFRNESRLDNIFPDSPSIDEVTFRRCWYAEGLSNRPTPRQQETLLDAVSSARSEMQVLGTSQSQKPATGVEVKSSWIPQFYLGGVGLELLAGGIAGCCVDVTLHPIDTLKTRQQAIEGFHKAGGFHRLWQGVASPALAAIPASAVFWAAYEPLKKNLYGITHSHIQSEIVSATFAEVASLLVRVPSEVLKQRMQAGMHSGGLMELVRNTHNAEGFRGFYVGFGATCNRSVPFALIQFPVYEELKRHMDKWVENDSMQSSAWVGGLSGALAGAIAGVVTTPLDVIKTRIMLAPAENRLSFLQMTAQLWRDEGAHALLSGVVPRSLYLSLGGMVYLGAYNGVADYLRSLAPKS